MNFKTKAIALLAGSALALSVASGAMAQTGDGTSVTLSDDTTCSVVFDGADVNFGTYKWNGSSYAIDGVAGNTSLTVAVTDPTQAQNGCDFEVGGGAMSPDTTGNTSGSIAVQFTYNSVTSNPLPVTDAADGDHSITAAISSTLDNAFSPDTYSGTVTITNVGNAS